MRLCAGLALLVLLAGPARADPAAAMAATVDGFYTARLALSPADGDGIPDATGRARLARFLSPRLNRTLTRAAAAEIRFRAIQPNAPPLMAGDLFSSDFDGPTAFKVEACGATAGDHGRCTVALSRAVRGRAPVAWHDTLLLVDSAGWKIDDIVYDPTLTTGNTGRLSDLLSMVAREAP